MKMHVICVAYERYEPLEILIRSFIVQTNPNWILHVIYDGPVPQKIMNIFIPFTKDERIRLYNSPIRYQKYGHPNRSTMLQTITTEVGDFILMTNDDNYYVPRFVDFFLNAIKPEIGIVYCNTLHSLTNYDVHNSTLGQGGIDIGAFMVRTDVAKQTGFNHDDAQADGFYAGECLLTCKKKRLSAIKIEKPLYIHN